MIGPTRRASLDGDGRWSPTKTRRLPPDRPKQVGLLLAAAAVATALLLAAPPVLAYSQQQQIPYSQYSFVYNLSPAGPLQSQQNGFYDNDPIRYITTSWDPQNGVLRARVYAMTPINDYKRPNANATLEL
ncbi:MAG: hypothetical protein QXG08_06160, partial [Candidatus Methanomethyliaceae archaeon]